MPGMVHAPVGPLLPEHRSARQSDGGVPGKDDGEIEEILPGVWDNLGRIGAEFAQLDRLSDYNPEHPERRLHRAAQPGAIS